MELEAIIENVHKLSSEELQQVRVIIDKELLQKRAEEIEEALKQAKNLHQKISSNFILPVKIY